MIDVDQAIRQFGNCREEWSCWTLPAFSAI